jgi:hypothetical protein
MFPLPAPLPFSVDRLVRDAGRGRLAVAGLLAALLAAPATAESIVGVCPDGSVFIVQSSEDVPCAEAKRVEAGEVPPLRPEYLPRPYQWEVFHAQQDPNNPYNLVDRARAVREAGAPPQQEAPGADEAAQPPAPPAPPPQVASAPPPEPAAPPPRRLEVALSDQEKRDLALIVELSQQRAPATLSRQSGGAPTLVLRLAHSAAFEDRLHQAAAAAGRPVSGPVVLFSAEAAAPESFHANLTFAQAHTAYHPEREDPAQFGLVEGHLGALQAGQRVLGYVVLPVGVDPSQPIDVYWNDRRLVTTLRP